MYYPFVRKALFQLDPERAHEFTFQQLRRITGTPFEALVRQKVPAKPVNCMGLTFKNPLGLAAGLDKDGECIDALGAMGFGSIEIGTVTPRPQPGNDKPRLFRLVDAEGLINRMGFNNLGVDNLVENVKKAHYDGVLVYSGTVAAAMEGRHLGFPALAVSLDGHKHYDTAAAVTCSILRALCKEPLRTGRILNINVPDLPLDQIKGIRVTRCGTRHPADQVIPQQDPRGNTLYWIGPPGGKCDAGPGTDFAAVDEGYVSITPLHVDLTAHSAQDVVSDWLNSVGVGTQW